MRVLTPFGHRYKRVSILRSKGLVRSVCGELEGMRTQTPFAKSDISVFVAASKQCSLLTVLVGAIAADVGR